MRSVMSGGNGPSRLHPSQHNHCGSSIIMHSHHLVTVTDIRGLGIHDFCMVMWTYEWGSTTIVDRPRTDGSLACKVYSTQWAQLHFNTFLTWVTKLADYRREGGVSRKAERKLQEARRLSSSRLVSRCLRSTGDRSPRAKVEWLEDMGKGWLHYW